MNGGRSTRPPSLKLFPAATSFPCLFVLVFDLLPGPSFDDCKSGSNDVFPKFKYNRLGLALGIVVVDREKVFSLFRKQCNRADHNGDTDAPAGFLPIFERRDLL